MGNDIELQDMYLGKTDAKHELLENTKEEIERFENSFLIPDNIIIDDFLESRTHFIMGLKGTGKTSLLRYIGLKANDMTETYSTFILFKSQFDKQNKEDFTKASNTFMVDIKRTKGDSDFVEAWTWFFHQYIVKMVDEQNLTVFERDKNWEKYKACISSMENNNESKGLHKYFPRIKHGNVEVGANFQAINGKLGLDFEFSDSKKTKVKFGSILNEVNMFYSNLTKGTGKMFIMFDELELSITSDKENSRDARMVRDVIIAINKFNNMSRANGCSLTIIAAIRSEVMTSVSTLGKEINKIVTDFGIKIYWHQAGGDINTHPILQILSKRLISAEIACGLGMSSSEEIWNKYFPKTVQGIDTPRYILHQTWYRPRDIVRLLTVAKNQFPRKKQFDQEVFDAIRKNYSEESWIELTEELTVTYSIEQINGIKRLLYGYKPYFSYGDIDSHATKICELESDIENLLKEHKLGDILKQLYKIGFIGNVTKSNNTNRYRFSYRGDDELLLNMNMMVHFALRPHLSIFE